MSKDIVYFIDELTGQFSTTRKNNKKYLSLLWLTFSLFFKGIFSILIEYVFIGIKNQEANWRRKIYEFKLKFISISTD
jgi:hypothetical protein